MDVVETCVVLPRALLNAIGVESADRGDEYVVMQIGVGLRQKSLYKRTSGVTKSYVGFYSLDYLPTYLPTYIDLYLEDDAAVASAACLRSSALVPLTSTPRACANMVVYGS